MRFRIVVICFSFWGARATSRRVVAGSTLHPGTSLLHHLRYEHQYEYVSSRALVNIHGRRPVSA